MAVNAPSLFLALVGLLREIPATHFDRAELAALGRKAGLAVTGTWSFSEQVGRLLATRPPHAPRLSQEIVSLES